jgi:hypothetical protein
MSDLVPMDEGKIHVSPAIVEGVEADDEPEGPEEYENSAALLPFEKWMHDSLMQVLVENQALVGEVRATRSELSSLREYVMELEEKASAMASPEAMQAAMQKMMGGMGF